MISLLDHTFKNELKILPDDYSVLLTGSPFVESLKANREKMTEIMFEGFKVASFYVTINSVLALYASGRLTGTVIDLGEGDTDIVSIYDGYALPDTHLRMELGEKISQTSWHPCLRREDTHSLPRLIDNVSRLDWVSLPI